MAGEHLPVSLRLEPHQLPVLRAAFDEALIALSSQMAELRRFGHIPGPWLGDEVSIETVEYYNQRVMGPEGTPYAALLAFERELTAVRDTLKAMEDHYRRTEGENTERWGRRA